MKGDKHFMKTTDLNDKMMLCGIDFDKFADALQDIESATYVTEGYTDAVSLLSYIREDAPNDGLIMSITSKDTLSEYKPRLVRIKRDTLELNGVDAPLLHELMHDSKLMMQIGGVGQQANDFYLTTRALCRDLGARAALAGDAMYNPSLERDRHIMYCYLNSQKCKFVVRGNNDGVKAIHKIFAMPSTTYCYIPQTVILDIKKSLERELGKAVCESWSITHFFTEIFLTFPEKANDLCEVYELPDEFIPGIRICTSDTGDSGLIVEPFWTTDKKKAYLKRTEREHRGKFSSEEFLKNFMGDIIPLYTKWPAKLAELLTIDIPEPEAAVEKVLQMVHAEKILGKKRTNALLETLNCELAISHCTAYDIAMFFLNLPTRYDGDIFITQKLEELAGKIPTLDFDKVIKATTKITLK